GSVTVTATGGTAPYTILWSNGGTTFTANNFAAGTYTAVVTDANGCNSNVSVTITQPATALASTNTTTNVSCYAGNNGIVTVTATGGTAPYTILWSNGGTTFTANNFAAGTYTAVITDANGCTSNVSVT
ncbi:SprB repeat-containing protein, partial [Flavobacterium sp. J49]|uniref:SprB repeat-containing protein n=1 Tax=Flavobacterium sp. J49 TaxID=2718534 RepID=UPI0015943D5E